MAVTEAQRRAHAKYFSKAYKQVKLSMPNGEVDALNQHCQKFEFSKAGFIRRAIKETIERDNGVAESHTTALDTPERVSTVEHVSDTTNEKRGVESHIGGAKENE